MLILMKKYEIVSMFFVLILHNIYYLRYFLTNSSYDKFKIDFPTLCNSESLWHM